MEDAMEKAAGSGTAEPSSRAGRIHGEARGGFTLVELLVVIVIIGLLAGIAVPVVMQSLTKARNAAIKAEIDMLHMAIMNYKNEYGSFPPCVPGSTTPSLPIKHLRRIFPRIASDGLALQQLTIASTGSDGAGLTDGSCLNNFNLTPSTALVFWLEGYTGNPTAPLVPASQRQRVYDFDRSRKSVDNNNHYTGIYHAPGKPNAPFIYIDAPHYGDVGSIAVPGFNADTFQILSAGRDEIWGNDDDLSNFWPGTRREYLDSLK